MLTVQHVPRSAYEFFIDGNWGNMYAARICVFAFLRNNRADQIDTSVPGETTIQ